MNTIEHLFVCANEEALEIGMAADKVLRFGQENVYPAESDTNNMQDFTQEVNDLMGVLELMQEHGVAMPDLFCPKAIAAKKIKIMAHMVISTDKGTLEAA